MDILLLRHGMTAGNLQKRYIGCRTDEPLCEEGRRGLIENKSVIDGICASYDELSVFSSPLVRCRETAGIYFDNCQLQICDDLREMDFGVFEGKNHSELDGDKHYQQWIDSNCQIEINGGEGMTGFSDRCQKAFCEIVQSFFDLEADRESGNNSRLLAVVCHGGTIMSIMSGITGEDFYRFMTGNGEGYLIHNVGNADILFSRSEFDGSGDNGNNTVSYDRIFDRVHP